MRRPLGALLPALVDPRLAPIFHAMLVAPDRRWTIGQMAAVAPDVPVNALRTTATVMLGDNVADLVSGGTTSTFQLSPDGIGILRAIQADRQGSD